MFDSFITGFLLVFQWPAIGFLALGVFIGVWLGVIPGLGGILGLILLLPFTFGMDTVPAIALLLGMFAVTATSDTITSVMLGIPGTVSSQATILDGHPLAQQGHASRALGAAFTVSAFGGVFGALVLAVSLPIVTPLIRLFTSPELFMLGLLGLTMVGTLAGSSVRKGLIVAALGLLFSTIGFDDVMGLPRFYFGTTYLLDGLPLIPVVLGLFAIPELLELAVRNVSISRVPEEDVEGGDMKSGFRDAVRNWPLALRCSAIGTYVGILPGLGSAIVDWIAYGHAVQSAKDRSRFGSGDIRGVIAPEAANNATRGGSLIPTVAFGIPGDLGAAILMGALLIQGIRPGPEMLTINLHITYSLVWSIVVANLLVVAVLTVWARQIARVAFIPGHLIVPGVLVFVFMGAWLGGASLGDWVACLAMGALGFLMKRGGWPRPPLVLALILGTIIENAFQISMNTYDGVNWLTRPIVLVIGVLILITIALSVRGITRNRAQPITHPSIAGEGTERNALVSLPLAVLLLVAFSWALWESNAWPFAVKLFPVIIAIPAAALLLTIVATDVRALTLEWQAATTLKRLYRETADRIVLGTSAAFFGYLVAMVLIMLVVGQKLALTLLVAVYLIRWGRYGWPVVTAYTAGAWLILVLFYDRVMHLLWHPAWLTEWLPSHLPDWLPPWLFV